MEYLIGQDNSRREIKMFYFTLLDIMFFPYLFHLPIKLSMLTLLYWLIKRKNGSSTEFNLTLLLTMILGAISVCFGLWKGQTDNTVIFSNIQTLVIVLYGYVVYEYAKVILKKYGIDLTDMFLIYLMIASAFMLLYWFLPSLFFEIRPFWTLQESGEVFGSYGGNRFTFLVSEPNNFAALVVGMMAFLVNDDRLEGKEKFIVIVLSACLVITTASNSGMVYFVIALFFTFITKNSLDKVIVKRNKSNFRKLFMNFALLCVVVSIITIVVNINAVLQMDLIQSATTRYKLYVNDSNVDYSGARLDIWKANIESRNILEYILFGDASVGKTHSGHLYVIYGFGCVVYGLLIKNLLLDNLRNKRAVIIRIIFFAVFTMNTFIVDLRSFTLFAVLLGATSLKITNYIDLNTTK